MKYLMSLFLIFTFFISNAHAIDKVIKIGYFESYPYVFKNKDGKADGLIVNSILKKINDNGNYNLEFIYFPLARGFHELHNGKIDILSITTDNLFLEIPVLHHSIPICQIPEYIFVTKNSNIKDYKNSHLFKNKVIGIRTGVTLPKYFEQKKNNITLSETSGEAPINKLLQKLINKRVDLLYLSNPKAGILEAKKNGWLNQLRIIKIGDFKTSIYIGFSKNLEPNVKDTINNIIIKDQDKLKISCDIFEN
ncbi:substrate-binding periplasmic protein [Fluviispira multicolorata]|uniref:Transporter substrate-binding domain-containing protein n=1 Tax=Fluviispira multicolorata TaxID=2654512 RepID=A0A833N7K0_9BACT|nr:transporter substrate-binding domain-containing protein [Fluviispira multicolorata]KAB8032245.1 transporter substrate-binding domain-containing protein [Fluviispira multicolorata]